LIAVSSCFLEYKFKGKDSRLKRQRRQVPDFAGIEYLMQVGTTAFPKKRLH